MPLRFLATILTLTLPALAEAPWRFINLPDWHSAEKYVSVWPTAWSGQFASYEEYRSAKQAGDRATMQGVFSAFGGELVIMPGDTQGGHWDASTFVNNFTSVPEYTGLSGPEVVVEAAHLCYSGMRQPFADAGYPKVFVAVGDHEIGDNDWAAGTTVSDLVPKFREGFADIWNEDTGGTPIYNTPIGAATARPLGTPYAETSYAAQHKNVLFITVDIFRQDDPAVNLGPSGSVIGSLTGGHLTWFTNVLSEAQSIRSIDHIVVQAHLPTIYPVRKTASSGMLVTGTTNSTFIQAMRQYGVDVYFAGEVHDNTVTMDDQSDLVQVVARGNGASNVTVIDVEDDRLTLNLYKGTTLPLGNLVIDKSGAQAQVTGSGLFTPIDRLGLQNHYTFDELVNESEVVTSANGSRTISGTTCTDAFRNSGGFADDYVAYADQCTPVAGKIGPAIEMTANSKLGLSAMGPIEQGFERTVACWVQTTSSNRQILFNTTSKWGSSGQFFNLSLDNGKLELILKEGAVKTSQSPLINDGSWHHVAAVVPQSPCTLSQARLFIDGTLQTDLSHSGGATTIDTKQSNWMAFGTILSDSALNLANKFGMTEFTGCLDEMCVWTRALSDADVKALAGGADARGYNASDMEQLFKLSQAAEGSAQVDGELWTFDPALTGPAGVFESAGSTMTLVLGTGGGLGTTIAPDAPPTTPPAASTTSPSAR